MTTRLDELARSVEGNELMNQLVEQVAADRHRAGHCGVCGKNTRRDPGRCTNGRCGECHRTHCTPGGDTSPGHGKGDRP